MEKEITMAIDKEKRLSEWKLQKGEEVVELDPI